MIDLTPVDSVYQTNLKVDEFWVGLRQGELEEAELWLKMTITDIYGQFAATTEADFFEKDDYLQWRHNARLVKALCERRLVQIKMSRASDAHQEYLAMRKVARRCDDLIRLFREDGDMGRLDVVQELLGNIRAHTIE